MLEEMFEERVGDVLRFATPGLEGQLIPSFDQLTTEALAFSIPGAGMRVAHYARGGEGFRQMAKNEELGKRANEKFRTEEEEQVFKDDLKKAVDSK